MAVHAYLDGGHALRQYEQVTVHLVGTDHVFAEGEVFLRGFRAQVRQGKNDRIFPWEAIQQIVFAGRSPL